jgi:hypothetical protein
MGRCGMGVSEMAAWPGRARRYGFGLMTCLRGLIGRVGRRLGTDATSPHAYFPFAASISGLPVFPTELDFDFAFSTPFFPNSNTVASWMFLPKCLILTKS